jgi:hypothetical protein
MSTAAERARENARRLSKTSGKPPPEPAAAYELTPAERVKPIRTTLDLSPALYAAFEDWTISAGRKIGRKISRTDVLRALVRRLVDDEGFSAEILQMLREDTRR